MTVAQRNSTIDRANATLNINTSIRSQRMLEIEDLKKRIEALEHLIKVLIDLKY